MTGISFSEVFISEKGEDFLEVVSQNPLNTSRGVLLITENRFLMKIQKKLSETKKWDYFRKLPLRYQESEEIRFLFRDSKADFIYTYRAYTIGRIQEGELKKTSRRPRKGEKAGFLGGNHFNLIHNSDVADSIETEIKILEGGIESDINVSTPVSICPHEFQEKSANSVYSEKSKDLGTQRKQWSHIPQNLSIRKNHDTGDFEIYDYREGDETRKGALWIGNLKKIVQIANKLAGYQDFKLECRGECPGNQDFQRGELR